MGCHAPAVDLACTLSVQVCLSDGPKHSARPASRLPVPAYRGHAQTGDYLYAGPDPIASGKRALASGEIRYEALATHQAARQSARPVHPYTWMPTLELRRLRRGLRFAVA